MDMPSFDVLIEAEKMRALLSSLKELSQQSEGVLINGEVIPWEKAFPLIGAFPDFQSTQQQTNEWMGIAASSWDEDYHKRIKKVVARKIAENSTPENDNLYLWSLLNVTHKVLSRLINYTDRERLHNAEPGTLSAVKDLLTALDAVTTGTQSTAKIRNELFLSGIDNVLMEFQMLCTQAEKDGNKEAVAEYIHVLTVIESLKEQTINHFKEAMPERR